MQNMMMIKVNLHQWSMANNIFDKKSSDGAVTRAQSETLETRDKSAIKSKNIWIKQIAENLHKRIIKKFEKRKVYSLSKTIFGVLIL